MLAGLGAMALAAVLVRCEGWEEPATPTLTEGELLALELVEPGGQVTYSAEECIEIFEAEPWCSVVKSAKRITRPEWEELFPHTDFYLVSYNLHGGESVQEKNALIVEHNGRYTAETFDFLLAANGITTVTDENRELVARAFVLMALDEYLEGEIAFSDSGEATDGPRAYLHVPCNYGITAWTEIQGLEFRWWFLFLDDRLRVVHGGILEYGVGDYIDVPYETLSPSVYRNVGYSFWDN